MNKKIYAVVGTGFGDEGKGIMTDYLSDTNDLVIKVNGGAQAGHTVCQMIQMSSEDIKFKKVKSKKYWANMQRFVFRQLGSGSFRGANTYLGPEFMVNFTELFHEMTELNEVYGVVNSIYIDNRCRVTLPVHVELNKVAEGTLKNGSCQLGIYETFHANEYTEYKMNVQDLANIIVNYDSAKSVELLNEHSLKYAWFRLKELGKLDVSQSKFSESELNKALMQTDLMKRISIQNTAFVKVVKGMEINWRNASDKVIDTMWINMVNNINDIPLEYRENYVFECSQGLELDMNREDNAPHLTPSNTGLKNVLSIIDEIEEIKNTKTTFEPVFVTRSYRTKHGNGDFPTYNPEIQSEFGLSDRTNLSSVQGELRYGLLDLDRATKLIAEQLELASDYAKNNKNLKISPSMAITHLDQTQNMLITTKGNIEVSLGYAGSLFDIYGNCYLSFGETRDSVYVYDDTLD
jgi:adenylosuccinate synthase